MWVGINYPWRPLEPKHIAILSEYNHAHKIEQSK
jgi:hypothetical protein